MHCSQCLIISIATYLQHVIMATGSCKKPVELKEQTGSSDECDVFGVERCSAPRGNKIEAARKRRRIKKRGGEGRCHWLVSGEFEAGSTIGSALHTHPYWYLHSLILKNTTKWHWAEITGLKSFGHGIIRAVSKIKPCLISDLWCMYSRRELPSDQCICDGLLSVTLIDYTIIKK